MRIISLGWGIQSFTLAAMSALGELPAVDVAIHSDTLHESKLTYGFAERWTGWLVERGVRVVTVRNPTGGIFEILANKPGQTHIPLFTKYTGGPKMVPEIEWIPFINEDGDYDEISEPTGRMVEVVPNENGQLRRSCTHRWKVIPIRRWLQANRNKQNVEQWIGISTDEALRMKPSSVGYVEHRWPLIEMDMSRLGCIGWLKKNDIEVPPSSSCTFCPYHDTDTWIRYKNTPEDWEEALQVDSAVRDVRPSYNSFIHPARVPLAEVDLRTPQEKGQLSLWDEECEGICGV